MKRVFIPLILCLLAFGACKNETKEQPSENTEPETQETAPTGPFFDISLAQWSLHKKYEAEGANPFDFAKDAKALGFDAVEYVTQLYEDQVKELGIQVVVDSLKTMATQHEVSCVLIMVDHEGDLADPDETKRNEAVENHKKWVDATVALGGHAIRVNTFGTNDPEEWLPAVTDGLTKLSEYAATKNINVLVENHGWLSSDAGLVMKAITMVDMDNCGTLPDFGNWCVKRADEERWGDCVEEYPDIYDGTKQLMGAAKAVSAKAYDFNEAGGQDKIDYVRMLQIVKDAGYTGYIGIEYEGDNLPEEEGIAATKALLLSSAQQLK